MYLTEELQKKWQPVLEHPELETIKDPYKKQEGFEGLDIKDAAKGNAKKAVAILGELWFDLWW